MKKITILLIILLISSLFVTASAAGERIIITPENFGVKGVDASNKRDSSKGGFDGTDATGLFAPTVILHKMNTSPVAPATMKFYIADAGNYKIWARVKDQNDATDRRVTLKIDNGALINTCTLTKPSSIPASPLTWYWDTPTELVNLSQGWHTLEANAIQNNYARLDVVILEKEGNALAPSAYDAIALASYDHTAPVFPVTAPTITSTDTTVTISDWPDAADAGGVVEYQILKKVSGSYVKAAEISPSAEKTYTESSLDEGSLYEYAIKAYDNLGQYSQIETSISTTGTLDITPPAWQSGDAVTFSNIGYTTATVSFPAATDNKEVTGYNIYKNNLSTLIATTTNLTYDLVNLDDGSLTTIFVEAFDSRNNKATPISAQVTTLKSINYLLKHENFTPQSDATWALEDIIPATGGENVLPLGKVFNNGANGNNGLLTATVYIPQDGTYNLWANTRDYATSNPGSRTINLLVDGVLDDTQLGIHSPPIDGWAWYKAKGQTFTEGWHTISVRGVVYSRFAAIYLTNNMSAVPENTAAYYTDNLQKYADVTPPSTAGMTFTTELIGSDSLKFDWDFTDTEIRGYRVSINNVVKVTSSAKTYTLSDLYELQNVDLKIEALDAYQNASVISRSVPVTKFSVNKFEIRNSSGVAVNSLASLTGSATGYVDLTNITSDTVNTVLSISAVDKTTNRIIYTTEKDVAFLAGIPKNDSVNVTLPADNYTLLLSIWEKDTQKPLLIGVKLSN